MTAKKDTSREAAIQALRERCSLIVEFLASRGFIEPEMWRRAIDGAVAAGKLTPMRILARELDHASKLMITPAMLLELNAQLRARLGIEPSTEHSAQEARIERILARGTIRNDAEHRFVAEIVEELGDVPQRAQQRAALLELLNAREAGR